MAILGINNRTENWKTARYFAPLLQNSYAKAELARKLGEDPGTSRADVDLELFWKGMRDYVDKARIPKGELAKTCVEKYKKEFHPSLRINIKEFAPTPPKRPLEPLKPHNYRVSENGDDLFNNLQNTEIDIVLETPNRLLIGEAKGEAGLGTRGAYVLVHQLIRQYVMATILLKVQECDKEVVPFLVVEEEKYESVLNTGQVQFMISQEWLKKKNVLTWADIRSLQP